MTELAWRRRRREAMEQRDWERERARAIFLIRAVVLGGLFSNRAVTPTAEQVASLGEMIDTVDEVC